MTKIKLMIIISNMLVISSYTWLINNIYIQNYMMLFETIIWFSFFMTTLAAFGIFVGSTDGEISIIIEKVEHMLNTKVSIFDKLLILFGYITVGVIGIIGGDLSLFIPIVYIIILNKFIDHIIRTKL